MNPQHCIKPYDRDMSAQREARTFSRRIETPMIDAVLREAKEASGLPNHLVYVGPKLLTASTPPPGGFLPSIPPSGRAAMRRVVITGDNSAPNELECIRLQGNTMKEGVARARMSRTRKRDEDKENVMYDDRKSAEVDALYEIAAKLRADLKAASKKVGAKALLVRKLRDHLKGENEAADAAWSRASALEETVEKSEIAVEQASLAVAIEAAHSNDVCTRGFDVAEEMTYTEWEARNDEDDAKKDAEKAKNSLKEAKEHARTREGGVVACEGLLHKAEASLAKAQRIEIYIRNSFSCASARASTFDNEQCMPKVKRVRR